MTEEITQAEEVKKKKPAAKKEKASACKCADHPVVEFTLPALKGTLQGKYCSGCYSVKEWKHVSPEPVLKPVKEVAPKKEEASVPKEPKEPKAKKQIQLFEIVDISPVESDPAQIHLSCKHKGATFAVYVNSTVEKVNSGLANKAKIIGMLAELEFEKVTGHGIPIDPIVKSYKPNA